MDTPKQFAGVGAMAGKSSKGTTVPQADSKARIVRIPTSVKHLENLVARWKSLKQDIAQVIVSSLKIWIN